MFCLCVLIYISIYTFIHIQHTYFFLITNSFFPFRGILSLFKLDLLAWMGLTLHFMSSYIIQFLFHWPCFLAQQQWGSAQSTMLEPGGKSYPTMLNAVWRQQVSLGVAYKYRNKWKYLVPVSKLAWLSVFLDSLISEEILEFSAHIRMLTWPKTL